MRFVDLHCDVLVAGGGLAGVCAAISAARHGARVILVQDRSRLGGNSSSEVRMHVVGADCHGQRPNWREGGLIEELRLEDAVRNPFRSFELWDLLLYEKCIAEPNLTLLLDTTVYSVSRKGNRIESLLARCDRSEHLYQIEAQIFCDCTGDSRLSLEAGAEFRIGREGRAEFGESLAPAEPDSYTQGSSILFTARRHDRPVSFQPPRWARRIEREQLRFRRPGKDSWEYGYWWIELGGNHDTIHDNERIRFELLGVVLGVWDYIKNSGEFPSSANWALETVGMLPGKRESRRVMGEVIQTQDLLDGGWKELSDGVAIGGWNFDDHPPAGFNASDEPPFTSVPLSEPYNISLGALYSKDVVNLMMAGRNISNSHVAFSSTRVMATCACIGQAVGTAAAACVRRSLLPAEIRNDPGRMRRLQQRLLRDDQSIRGAINDDHRDRARRASVTASAAVGGSRPENILTGRTRDKDGTFSNRWAAAMPEPAQGDGPWIELHWAEPVIVRRVQITFDTGFERELTLSASEEVSRRVIRGHQPETVKDYRISAETVDRGTREVLTVTGNYQRLRRHSFAPMKLRSLRLQVLATNGDALARIYEIRCY